MGGADEHRVSQDGVGDPDQLDRLWTPHRIAYIRGENKPADETPGECPFCRVPGLPDDQGLVVARLRGALELRLPAGDAALRAMRSGQGDADLGWRDGARRARGHLRGLRVGGPRAKDRAAVPARRNREADRFMDEAGAVTASLGAPAGRTLDQHHGRVRATFQA